MRPKSIATVVADFMPTSLRSSIPTDAVVIAASVVSGVISDTAPTNVVLPTPKPPATTIFSGISDPAGMSTPTRASAGAQSTEQPLQDLSVGAGVVLGHVEGQETVRV